MLFLLSVLPLALLLVLMTKLSTGKAALIDLAVTASIALVFFKADLALVFWESVKGAWDALPIILIILTAVLLYQVGRKADAFSSLRLGLERLLPDELLLVLALGWGFSSFLQGISGFGVPVAVVAPLLAAIGVNPVYAVMTALLGQSWGNTFGTLAAAWDALAVTAGNIDYNATALWASFFIFLWNLALGLVICFFYGRGKALLKGLPCCVVISLVQGGGEMLMSQFNTTLCCFLPSTLSLLAVLALSRLPLYSKSWRIPDSPMMDRKGEEKQEKQGMSMAQSLLPYLVLTVLTLASLSIGPVKAFLGKVSFALSVPETRTALGVVNPGIVRYSPLAVFSHASFFLLLSALTGYLYYKSKGLMGKSGSLIKETVRLSVPSALTVLLLMMMSKIMSGAGMTKALSEGIAGSLGHFYALLVPFVGLIGTFSTGSNLSSNILFSSFQFETASLLGLNTSAVLGASTAGAAIGSMVSPGKILLGTSTTGLSGKEGMILSRLMRLAIPAVLLIGLILILAA